MILTPILKASWLAWDGRASEEARREVAPKGRFYEIQQFCNCLGILYFILLRVPAHKTFLHLLRGTRFWIERKVRSNHGISAQPLSFIALFSASLFWLWFFDSGSFRWNHRNAFTIHCHCNNWTFCIFIILDLFIEAMNVVAALITMALTASSHSLILKILSIVVKAS
jgi:hypothetical protein